MRDKQRGALTSIRPHSEPASQWEPAAQQRAQLRDDRGVGWGWCRSGSEGGGNMAKDRQLGASQPGLEDSLGWDGWKGFRGRRGAGLGIKIVRGKEFELSSGVCEF